MSNSGMYPEILLAAFCGVPLQFMLRLRCHTSCFSDLSWASSYSLNIFTKFAYYFGYCNLRMLKITEAYKHLYSSLLYFQKLLMNAEISLWEVVLLHFIVVQTKTGKAVWLCRVTELLRAEL